MSGPSPLAPLARWVGLPTLVLLAAACSDGAPLVDLGADALAIDGLHPEAGLPDGPAPGSCAPSTALVGGVDPSRLQADLAFLVGLGERKTLAGQQAALGYLRAGLAGLAGLELRDHTYLHGGQSFVNLEVTIAGSEAPDRYIMAGAHYDSISNVPSQAPGADDNASGVAALLEAARVLAGCAPRQSIRLLFFSNEEIGTVGSKAYVEELKTSVPPGQVTGFIAVDSVAFGPAGEELDLASKPAQQSFVRATREAMERWTELPVKEVIDDHCG